MRTLSPFLLVIMISVVLLLEPFAQAGTLAPPQHPSLKTTSVYIGDSHSAGCFGEEIDRTLRALPMNNVPGPLHVRTRATCGSRTASWLNPNGNSTVCGFRSCDDGNCTVTNQGHADSLVQLIRTSPPQLVVVELGTNMLKDSLTSTLANVRTTIDLIQSSGSRCIWIGPPQAKTTFISISNFDSFNEALKNEVLKNGLCTYIDSNSKTDRRNITDKLGLHYTCSDARSWAQRVSAELRTIH